MRVCYLVSRGTAREDFPKRGGEKATTVCADEAEQGWTLNLTARRKINERIARKQSEGVKGGGDGKKRTI